MKKLYRPKVLDLPERKATHTPGEWKEWISRDDNSLNISGGEDGKQFVCTIARDSDDRAIADARLIAAAPALLAALEAALSKDCNWPQYALSAINQAKGKVS